MSRNLIRSSVVALVVALAVPAFAFAQPAVRFQLDTAASYRSQARYPGHSWALGAGLPDPVADKRVPSRITVRGPEAGDPTLTVWPGKVSFLAGETVELFALVEGAEPVYLRAEILTQSGETVALLDYQPLPAQAQAGARTARIEGLPTPELAESYLVQVEALLPDGSLLTTATSFQLSNPGAALTGRYRDRLEEGNVVIAAQVEVGQAGRFHLIGTLSTPQGEPVGVAQTAVELTPGKHWVDLSFYGLMFHDRGVAGPFVLSSVTLSRTGGMPNALTDVVERAHTTRAYPLSQLRGTPFNAPDLLDAARRLELEAALTATRSPQGSEQQ